MDLSYIAVLAMIVVPFTIRPGAPRLVYVPLMGALGLAAALLVEYRLWLVATYALLTVAAMAVTWWLCDPRRAKPEPNAPSGT